LKQGKTKMKTFVNWTLATVFAFLLLCFNLCANAEAAVIQGNIKYLRNWIVDSCNNDSRIKCSDNGTNKNYGPAVISFQHASTGVVVTGTVSAAGLYSVTVPTPGPWQLRTHHRDGTNECTATGGTFSVAVVPDGASGSAWCTEQIDNIGSPVTIASSSETKTHNPVISSGVLWNRVTHYMLAQFQKSVWVTEYATTVLQSDRWKMRYSHFPTQSSCGASGGIDGARGECRVNMAESSTTLFHETGHAMMQIIQLRTINRTIRAPQSTPSCAPNTENAQRIFEEGFAEFIKTMTFWTPSTLPTFVNGNDCDSGSYPPLGGQPNAPACGNGAVQTRFRSQIERSLLDLADANTVVNNPLCRDEKVQISMSNIMKGLSFFGSGGGAGCSNGQCVGALEGGVSEGCFCTPGVTVASTPNWPYIGSNALPVQDQLGLLDYLGFLKLKGIATGSQLFDIWANSGWARGDSANVLP
jgi:hypothetical protein